MIAGDGEPAPKLASALKQTSYVIRRRFSRCGSRTWQIRFLQAPSDGTCVRESFHLDDLTQCTSWRSNLPGRQAVTERDCGDRHGHSLQEAWNRSGGMNPTS